jgi:hypothetical protein
VERGHGSPDRIVLVEQFLCPHEVGNPLLQMVKHADLHCKEEVGLQEITYDTGNQSKYIESSVPMV